MKDGEEQQESLFPELEGVEARGAAANLEAAQKRLGENLAAFLPWYFENNPGWIENCLREITVAAGESFRDFIGRKAETGEAIPAPFSVEFRFPVEVCPATLFVAPPPEIAEIPAAELAAFRERGREISAAAVERILQEKAAEAAASGTPPPEITPEQREEAIRAAEAAGEELLATHTERNLQADLGEWFTAWRWAYAINAGWTSYRDTGPDAAPESDTLCLFHFPAPERKEPDPLWKQSETIAFRLETLRAMLARGEDFPEGDGPEAVEGRKLFDQLCPEGKLEKLSIPLAGLKGETDPDPETGEKKPVSFNIKLEIHPLTFDYRGEQGAQREEPETYFPFIILCESEPGAAGWHEIPPEERQELFRRILDPLEADATPENWDFPDWQPLPAPEPEAEPKKRKLKKQRGPEAARLGRNELKRRLRPSPPKLETPDYVEHSHVIGRLLTMPERITDPKGLKQFLLPLDYNPELSGNRHDAEIITVGFDFSVPERRVIEAMERLYAKYGYPENLSIMTDIDTFAEACEIEKRATGKDQVAKYPGCLSDLLSAVESVGKKRGFLIFRDGSGEEETTLATTGFLWQPIWQWGKLTHEEKQSLNNHIITEAMRAKLRAIGIRLDPIWLRAQRGTKNKNLYYHRPANFREQLLIAGYSRRTPHAEAFLTWLLTVGEPKMHGVRKHGNAAEIKISLEALAGICRLPLRKNKKRTVQEIIRAAGYARAVGLITNEPEAAYDREQESFHFDLKDGDHWKKLHAWQAEKEQEKEADAARRAELAREKESKRKATSPGPVERRAQLETFRASLERENERIRRGKESGRMFDREISKQIERWEADLAELRNQKDTDPEARKEAGGILREAIQKARDILRGAALPHLPPRPAAPAPANPTPEPEAEQPPPDPDPEAAAIWEPILAAAEKRLPSSRLESLRAAIPARLEGDTPDRRLVLWFPSPPILLAFMCGEVLKSGPVSLAWISPGEEDEPTPFP